TFLLVLVGLVLVRCESWAGCWQVERCLFDWGGGVAATQWVPAWVPLLVLLVLAGHLFSGLRERRCGLLDLPPLLRASAYVAAVGLLVVFGPGSTKTFISFQF